MQFGDESLRQARARSRHQQGAPDGQRRPAAALRRHAPEPPRAAQSGPNPDTAPFLDRAGEIFGYPNFVCDTSGSICEVVEAEDPADPVMKQLSETLLMVWLKGSDTHTA